MKFRASFISYAKATLLVKPTDGAFDHPADFSQPAAMFGAALGEKRYDSQPSQDFTRGLRIVGAITVGASGRERGRPGLPRTAGMLTTIGRSFMISFVLAPESSTTSGTP